MSPLKIIKPHKANHRKQDVIVAGFNYDPKLTIFMKQVPGTRRRQSLKIRDYYTYK